MLCLLYLFQDTKSFDGWSLKKSILNTLLQAVKAIAGGVTTLQGQLIKGSGYLVQQKGKVRDRTKKRTCGENAININTFEFSFYSLFSQAVMLSQMLERILLHQPISSHPMNMVMDTHPEVMEGKNFKVNFFIVSK